MSRPVSKLRTDEYRNRDLKENMTTNQSQSRNQNDKISRMPSNSKTNENLNRNKNAEVTMNHNSSLYHNNRNSWSPPNCQSPNSQPVGQKKLINKSSMNNPNRIVSRPPIKSRANENIDKNKNINDTIPHHSPNNPNNRSNTKSWSPENPNLENKNSNENLSMNPNRSNNRIFRPPLKSRNDETNDENKNRNVSRNHSTRKSCSNPKPEISENQVIHQNKFTNKTLPSNPNRTLSKPQCKSRNVVSRNETNNELTSKNISEISKIEKSGPQNQENKHSNENLSMDSTEKKDNNRTLSRPLSRSGTGDNMNKDKIVKENINKNLFNIRSSWPPSKSQSSDNQDDNQNKVVIKPSLNNPTRTSVSRPPTKSKANENRNRNKTFNDTKHSDSFNNSNNRNSCSPPNVQNLDHQGGDQNKLITKPSVNNPNRTVSKPLSKFKANENINKNIDDTMNHHSSNYSNNINSMSQPNSQSIDNQDSDQNKLVIKPSLNNPNMTLYRPSSKSRINGNIKDGDQGNVTMNHNLFNYPDNRKSWSPEKSQVLEKTNSHQKVVMNPNKIINRNNTLPKPSPKSKSEENNDKHGNRNASRNHSIRKSWPSPRIESSENPTRDQDRLINKTSAASRPPKSRLSQNISEDKNINVNVDRSSFINSNTRNSWPPPNSQGPNIQPINQDKLINKSLKSNPNRTSCRPPSNSKANAHINTDKNVKNTVDYNSSNHSNEKVARPSISRTSTNGNRNKNVTNTMPLNYPNNRNSWSPTKAQNTDNQDGDQIILANKPSLNNLNRTESRPPSKLGSKENIKKENQENDCVNNNSSNYPKHRKCWSRENSQVSAKTNSNEKAKINDKFNNRNNTLPRSSPKSGIEEDSNKNGNRNVSRNHSIRKSWPSPKPEGPENAAVVQKGFLNKIPLVPKPPSKSRNGLNKSASHNELTNKTLCEDPNIEKAWESGPQNQKNKHSGENICMDKTAKKNDNSTLSRPPSRSRTPVNISKNINVKENINRNSFNNINNQDGAQNKISTKPSLNNPNRTLSRPPTKSRANENRNINKTDDDTKNNNSNSQNPDKQDQHKLVIKPSLSNPNRTVFRPLSRSKTTENINKNVNGIKNYDSLDNSNNRNFWSPPQAQSVDENKLVNKPLLNDPNRAVSRPLTKSRSSENIKKQNQENDIMNCNPSNFPNNRKSWSPEKSQIPEKTKSNEKVVMNPNKFNNRNNTMPRPSPKSRIEEDNNKNGNRNVSRNHSTRKSWPSPRQEGSENQSINQNAFPNKTFSVSRIPSRSRNVASKTDSQTEFPSQNISDKRNIERSWKSQPHDLDKECSVNVGSIDQVVPKRLNGAFSKPRSKSSSTENINKDRGIKNSINLETPINQSNNGRSGSPDKSYGANHNDLRSNPKVNQNLSNNRNKTELRPSPKYRVAAGSNKDQNQNKFINQNVSSNPNIRRVSQSKPQNSNNNNPKENDFVNRTSTNIPNKTLCRLPSRSRPTAQRTINDNQNESKKDNTITNPNTRTWSNVKRCFGGLLQKRF